MKKDAPLPLITHLKECKTRLMKVLGAWVVCAVGSYFWAQEIFSLLLYPYLWATKGMPGTHKLIYISMPEAFVTYIKVALFSGFLLSFPFFLFQGWQFIMPALHAQEKKILKAFIIVAPFLFLCGVLFAYFFVVPLAWSFFLSFENTADLVPLVLEARMSDYLSLIMSFLCSFGLSFEFPLVLLGLGYMGFLNANLLRKNRKYTIIIIFIVAAILTPPDVLSQILLAIPLLLLYEGTIFLMHRQEKKTFNSVKHRKKREPHV